MLAHKVNKVNLLNPNRPFFALNHACVQRFVGTAHKAILFSSPTWSGRLHRATLRHVIKRYAVKLIDATAEKLWRCMKGRPVIAFNH